MLKAFMLLLDAAASFLTFAFLARFAMQCVRAPFRGRVGTFVIAVTDWAVRPLRRFVPSIGGYDLVTLLLAWLCQGLYLGLGYGLALSGVVGWPIIGPIALMALLAVLTMALHLVSFAIIVSVLLSWLNPYAPDAEVFHAIARPVLAPLQRFIPLIGGVDISPMAALLLIQIAYVVLGDISAAILPRLY